MTITDQVTKNIITKLLLGRDYRIEVIQLIDAAFFEFTVGFFKKVADAKNKNEGISRDWYKKTFLDASLPADQITIHAGLNKKTIFNMFNTTKKELVISASNQHYDSIWELIQKLVDEENELESSLNIKFKDESVDLTFGESLIVINALAVKRSQIRGSFWSAAGKRVEKPLMQTICKLYDIPEDHYVQYSGQERQEDDLQREVDFYLYGVDDNYRCEVKLMGQGNPESADAVFARGSNIFVADKLSDLNKQSLDHWQIYWVELNGLPGFRKFGKILEYLDIPHKQSPIDIDQDLDAVFEEVFI